MRLYTLEDLTRHHNVNAVADEYRRNGEITAASYAENWTPEQWWHVHNVSELLRPLNDYVIEREYLGCSIGIERFAWMHFKEGWSANQRSAAWNRRDD